MKLSYEMRVARLNRAYNFFADTVGIDYVTGALSAAEVMREDIDNVKSVRDFPELRKLGY